MTKWALIGKVTLKPGKRAEILAEMQSFFAHVQQETSTEVYCVNESIDEPNVVWVYDVFSSKKAFEEIHTGSDEDKRFRDRVEPLMAKAPEVAFCVPLLAKGLLYEV